jgi:VanZ family protein
MLLIFAGSTDLLSSHHTSRFIEPFLRWLIPGISPAALERAHLAVRKSGHLTEYGVLAVLLWRARRNTSAHAPRAWLWSEAAFALCIASLYAASDEYHQLFYPSRYASVEDVLIDTVGAGIGLALLWVLGRWRKHW